MGKRVLTRWLLCRRDFLGLCGAMTASTVLRLHLADEVAASETKSSPGCAVATVFLDRPYIDPTGRAVPYRPPEVVGAGISNYGTCYGFEFG